MELLSHHRRHFLLCTLALLVTVNAKAQADLSIKLKTTVPILTASPNVCELKASQRACAIRVALVWEVPRAGNFCLYQQHNQRELACWTNTWSGVYQLDFKSGDSQHIQLKRQGSNNVLAQTPIKVIGAIEQKVRARRRSGIWRMF